MKITLADTSDAKLIHHVMIKAFMEYKDEEPPSSALEETVKSISTASNDGEQSLIGYIDTEPVGVVRFRLKENDVYFYRLSVIPEKQGQGIATKILRSLEDYAKQKGKTTMLCKVRMDASKNIKLYRSLGYDIYNEEVVHKPNGINIKVVSMMKKL